MSRNYIEITEKKIENIKNNLRVYTVDKLKKELEEAKAAYNDTGHDRYFKKMTRLEKELVAINEYLNGKEKTAQQVKEEIAQERRNVEIAYLWGYIKQDLNLPQTAETKRLDEIIKGGHT
jgi:uncharacterized protein YukE